MNVLESSDLVSENLITSISDRIHDLILPGQLLKGENWNLKERDSSSLLLWISPLLVRTGVLPHPRVLPVSSEIPTTGFSRAVSHLELTLSVLLSPKAEVLCSLLWVCQGSLRSTQCEISSSL